MFQDSYICISNHHIQSRWQNFPRQWSTKKSMKSREEEKQRKQTVCVIAPWQPIGSLSHECNQEWLLDLPCPAGEPVIVYRRRRGPGGAGGEIHDSLLQNLVDWLHVQENACGQRILNQHSLLPCQCRGWGRAWAKCICSSARKHWRRRENYISMGGSGWVRQSSFPRRWLIVMVP